MLISYYLVQLHAVLNLVDFIERKAGHCILYDSALDEYKTLMNRRYNHIGWF